MNKAIKHVLDNGLTVLLYPNKRIPKVSVQLWYHVGSKDEKEGQRGLAHLLEHMIFKGTKTLSESDINVISHKLSGYCNAFTSYDYTGYLFDFPKQHWVHSLAILADCMRNCTFDQEMLNSEMKAVIQELKMYRDDYATSIKEELTSALFAGHPYHYPIIGYKQDLWSVSADDLHEFYKEHYIPNNATLVVVGDIDIDGAIKEVESAFGHLEKDSTYTKKSSHFIPDFKNTEIALYRQVQQPLLVCALRLPGLSKRDNRAVECLLWLLAEGRGSRLQKKLIDQLQLVTDVTVQSYDLFDEDLLFIEFTPADDASLDEIKLVVKNELNHLYTVSDAEFDRAFKQAHMGRLHLFENTQELAYQLGQTYLATGDCDAFFNAMYEGRELKDSIKNMIELYFRPINIHWGSVLPLVESDHKKWMELQEASDALDNSILSCKIRNSAVQPAQLAHTIAPEKPTQFTYARADKTRLSNGLTILSHHREGEKIDLVLELKADHQYDPHDKQGLQHFGMQMLSEGTKKYTADQLAYEFESRGILYEVDDSSITLSFLKSELPAALNLLAGMLMEASFQKDSIEKIRACCRADLYQFWDTPSAFSTQLIRESLYVGHPCAQNNLGTNDSLQFITQDDLIAWYGRCVVPAGARLAVVGDINDSQLEYHISESLGKWSGVELPDIPLFVGSSTTTNTVSHPLNRDQIVLCFAGLSVSRTDADYDKLLIFDQIFGGGVIGSMNSYLFQLREESGLFYTIKGSLSYDADEHPGMTLVKTIVSADRLDQAEQAIGDTINTAVERITSEEFEQAKHILINNLVENFESNYATAQALIFIDRFKFDSDYFDARVAQLSAIALEDVKKAVSSRLHTDKLMRCYVGRLDQ